MLLLLFNLLDRVHLAEETHVCVFNSYICLEINVYVPRVLIGRSVCVCEDFGK